MIVPMVSPDTETKVIHFRILNMSLWAEDFCREAFYNF